MKKGFFNRFDWAAFWMATLATLAVYIKTLGPSVGLEDSGELATAAAHLGVPHPPGYPFWTLCCWIFCKVFSFVTYMGHPTPAWAVSCCSAVFGAFAAGCTAMLICRSAADFLAPSARGAAEDDRELDGATGWLCFGGGVGGALAFSFSPVEWSQSTIVEIYSLNALFLMWVFLLSYRWMRKPSDRILWLTAFVFGLGLTNYQVLLFAIVPIAIILCLRNFKMFRDFVLYLIPVALGWQLLKIGELQRASELMQTDAINKHAALLKAVAPSSGAVVFAIAVLLASFAAAAVAHSRGRRETSAKIALFGGGAAAVLFAAYALGIGCSEISWSVPGIDPMTGRRGLVADITAPLVDPKWYLWVAAFVAARAAAAVASAICGGGGEKDAKRSRALLCASGAFAVVAVMVACCVDKAGAAGYAGKPYDWAASESVCWALVAALVACALFVKRGLCYAIPVAGLHVAAFVLLQRGAMNGLTHPTSWWFWWPVAWNFTVLALVWIVLPNGRCVAGSAFFAQLGVSFYAYMPVVSDWRNPPMNWGYPRTWDGFKHAITRGQYEAIGLQLNGFADVCRKMGHYFSDVKMQFSDFLVFFAIVPFACWRFVRRGTGRNALHAVSAILALLLVRAVMVAAGIGDGGAWRSLDRVLIVALAALAAVGCAVMFLRQGVHKTAVATRRFFETAVERRDWIRIAAFAVLALVPLRIGWRMTFAPGGSQLPLAAVVAAEAGLAALALSSRAISRYARRAGKDLPGVEFAGGDAAQQWLLASGACFTMMSLVLILLANVKGDVQDGFIQKVKFISSHAMIAMWIGYGLVFVGVVAARFAVRKGLFAGRARLAAVLLAAAMILGAAVTPIVQNYTDDRLVFELGGAEQDGHTFGWQFGAYQLDGAKAIREQLTADEEPLPDPDWPEPMEPYSIFFGGTDPGRFVPTYMIYSANFRPDVYLITQNALADDTYMSVERDLYGDEIWIPAKEDSGEAFNRYVDEVKRGVRQANGDLRIENGRVQVTGALGVMEINGILTQMMFEHDRDRHAFYVEESYAIQWMYPYLSPHGLIMKINRDRTPYSAATARKDRDFWDWYVRRLLNDPMFRRDFAAQKSFSKLRTAIAGLYRNQGAFPDAVQAFREACLLYPASPEAAFRYVTEVLIPFDRTDAIQDLMDYTDAVDPHNERTKRIRSYLNARRDVERLEGIFREGKQTAADAYALAMRYVELGSGRRAADLMKQLAPMLNTEDELRNAANILAEAGMDAEAEKAMTAYLAKAKRPDPALLASMAVLQHRSGRQAAAYATADRAFKAGADAAAQRLVQYASSLTGPRADAMLWIKLAKFQSRAGMRNDAMQSLANAYSTDRELAERERHADRDIYNLTMMIIEEQQRRR